MNYDEEVFAMFGGRHNYIKPLHKLIAFADIKKTESVLELCCGTGLATKKIARRAHEVTAVELNRARMQTARNHLPKDVTLLEKNVHDLSPEDGTYDVVLCANGFHYFEEAEFYDVVARMLKPEGRCVYNVKLAGRGSEQPFHKTVEQLFTSFMQSLDNKFENVQIGHRAYLDSPYTPSNFTVPKPFFVTRKQVLNTYLDTNNKKCIENYWSRHAQDFCDNSGLELEHKIEWERKKYRGAVQGPHKLRGHAGPMGFWIHIYQNSGHYIDEHFTKKIKDLPGNLAKSELFVEMRGT